MNMTNEFMANDLGAEEERIHSSQQCATCPYATERERVTHKVQLGRLMTTINVQIRSTQSSHFHLDNDVRWFLAFWKRSVFYHDFVWFFDNDCSHGCEKVGVDEVLWRRRKEKKARGGSDVAMSRK